MIPQSPYSRIKEEEEEAEAVVEVVVKTVGNSLTITRTKNKKETEEIITKVKTVDTAKNIKTLPIRVTGK